MRTELSLEDYINATTNAGARVRRVVFLFSFASILSFMAFWNSRSDGWINMRYSLVEDANYSFYLDSIKSNPLKIKISKERDKVVSNFLENKSLKIKPQLDDLRDIYKNLKRETYLVRVPILGISFDINDLGLFKFVNMRYEPVIDSMSQSVNLNCTILLSPFVKQNYSFEIEGTNNGGNFGIAGNFGYHNKNTFRGAELYELKLKGLLFQ